MLEKIIPQLTRGLAAGLDVSPVMVENCRARYQQDIQAGKVEFQCGHVERIPYPDRYFTKVSSVNSLFYWSDIQQGFSEIYRILQEKGKVILTYTCSKDLEKKGIAQYGVKTYEGEVVRHMLVNVGFSEIQIFRTGDRHREFICMTGRK